LCAACKYQCHGAQPPEFVHNAQDEKDYVALQPVGDHDEKKIILKNHFKKSF